MHNRDSSTTPKLFNMLFIEVNQHENGWKYIVCIFLINSQRWGNPVRIFQYCIEVDASWSSTCKIPLAKHLILHELSLESEIF